MTTRAIVHRRGAFYMPVTPFCDGPEQRVDIDTYHALILRIVQAGAQNIICGAASGEGPELAPGHMMHLVDTALGAAKGSRANVYASVHWETCSALDVCEHAMSAGAAGVMELPPTYPYACSPGVERRYRAISAACEGNLIVYAKGDTGVTPSDALMAKLAGDGVICAVKRACASAAFAVTADAVRKANPGVLVVQGAAERYVLEVVGFADGYTTGTGVVFPHISAAIEAEFLAKDLEKVRELVAHFLPIELMRAEHNTGYNIAPLKWLLQVLYQIGNGMTRPRFMSLLPADEARLRAIAEPLVALEEQLARAAASAGA